MIAMNPLLMEDIDFTATGILNPSVSQAAIVWLQRLC